MALGTVVAVVLCLVPAAIVASSVPLGWARSASAGRPSGAPGVPSPRADAPAGERARWIRERMNATLAAQAAALTSGDQRGFLAAADPRTPQINAELNRRYGSLRALRTTRFEQTVVRGPEPVRNAGGRREWSAGIQVGYCFVVRDCVADSVFVDTTWTDTVSGPRLLTLDATDGDDNGPRPWEVSGLTAAVGVRTVVATTSRYASRLPALLGVAERAAANADGFLLPGSRLPDRYRIFVAGAAEWKKWYGGGLPGWSVGFATAVNERRMEVVLNVDKINESYLDEVLRHELGHVITLTNDEFHDDGNFWMIEGIAEYIQDNGRSLARYDGRSAVRRYLDEVDWDGTVNVSAPRSTTAGWQVRAKYGIGYYAMRRIGERFGRPKLMAFFTAVVQQGLEVELAAPSKLGVSWADVNADCATFIRRSAG